MTLPIEISDDTLRELEEKAAQAGVSASEFAARILRSHVTDRGKPTIGSEDAAPAWLDIDVMKEADAEADPSIGLDAVRQDLSSIRASMSDVIRSERDRD